MKNLILTLAILLSNVCVSSQNLLSSSALNIKTKIIELNIDSINKLMRYFQSTGDEYFQVESITYETTTLSDDEIVDIIRTRDLRTFNSELGRFVISVAKHSVYPDNIHTIDKVYYAIYDNPNSESYGYESTWIRVIVPKYEYSYSYLQP